MPYMKYSVNAQLNPALDDKAETIQARGVIAVEMLSLGSFCGADSRRAATTTVEPAFGFGLRFQP